MASKTYFGGDNLDEDERAERARDDHQQHVMQRALHDRTRMQRTELGAFVRWWTGTLDLSKCHLHQALRSYIQSFPARSLPLIQELIEAKAHEPA